MTRDPVCGMRVDEKSAADKFAYDGTTYFFCSPHCLEKFKQEPAKYRTHTRPAEQATATPATIYVCPMHPEVRESTAGACPKCGMALEPQAPAAPQVKTEYVCPMHPEIVRPEPGTCPICGMALEPRTVTLEEESNPELIDMTRRFWISAVLSVPLFLLALTEFLPSKPLHGRFSPHALNWFQLALATR